MRDGELGMNAWQQVLSDIIHAGVIVPKAIARDLGMRDDYLSDICRRDRVNPFSVFNRVLRAIGDTPLLTQQQKIGFALPILRMLVEGTCYNVTYVQTGQPITDYPTLCRHVGSLLQDLGHTVELVAEIEADGEVNERDDVAICECQSKINALGEKLEALSFELTRRRRQGATS